MQDVSQGGWCGTKYVKPEPVFETHRPAITDGRFTARYDRRRIAVHAAPGSVLAADQRAGDEIHSYDRYTSQPPFAAIGTATVDGRHVLALINPAPPPVDPPEWGAEPKPFDEKPAWYAEGDTQRLASGMTWGLWRPITLPANYIEQPPKSAVLVVLTVAGELVAARYFDDPEEVRELPLDRDVPMFRVNDREAADRSVHFGVVGLTDSLEVWLDVAAGTGAAPIPVPGALELVGDKLHARTMVDCDSPDQLIDPGCDATERDYTWSHEQRAFVSGPGIDLWLTWRGGQLISEPASTARGRSQP